MQRTISFNCWGKYFGERGHPDDHPGRIMLAGGHPMPPNTAVIGVDVLTQPMRHYLHTCPPRKMKMHVIPLKWDLAKLSGAATSVRELDLSELDVAHESSLERERCYMEMFRGSHVEKLTLPLARSSNPAIHRCHRMLTELVVGPFVSPDIVLASLLCSVIKNLKRVDYREACQLMPLRGNQHLTHLTLPGCLNPFYQLLPLLTEPNQLQSLSLSHGNQMDFDWYLSVPVPSLMRLELEGDGVCFENVVKFLRENGPNVTSLRFVKCPGYDGTANAALCGALGGKRSRILEVRAPGSSLTDDDVIAFAKLQNLRVLDLTGTAVTRRGRDILTREAPWILHVALSCHPSDSP